MNQLTKKIGEALSSHLNGFHFYTARSALIRKTQVGWQSITLDLLSTETKGLHKIASHGQVRIDALETLYTPLHPYLDPKQAKSHATLAINCDQLLRDEPLIHGVSLDSEQKIFNFAEAYAQCIQSSVVPWLDRYINEDSLYDGLASNDPMNWITSDPLTRYPVLMAILAKRREWGKFDEIANEFYDWCGQPHSTPYRTLAIAMRGLRQMADSEAERT